MEQLAPEAIGLGLGLGQSTQTVSAERRSPIVHAVGPRSMLVAPMDGQDFPQRVALQVAAWTVRGRQIGCVGDFVRLSRRPWDRSTRQRAAPSRTPAPGTQRARRNELLLFHRFIPSAPERTARRYPTIDDTMSTANAIPRYRFIATIILSRSNARA